MCSDRVCALQKRYILTHYCIPQEIGIDIHSGKTVIRVSEHFYRPAEVDLLIGNPQKAVKAFGFNPTKTPFKVCDSVRTLNVLL